MTPAPSAVDLADLVAEAVLHVDGVTALSDSTVATLLPGRRVSGVRLGETGCEVHVQIGFGSNAAEVAARIRSRVAPLVSGPIDVHIDDIAES